MAMFSLIISTSFGGCLRITGPYVLDQPATRAIRLSIWAAKRWNIAGIAVPGLPQSASQSPALNERHGLAVATLLREQGVAAVSAPAAGSEFQLTAAVQEPSP